jgi:hypothetical protein
MRSTKGEELESMSPTSQRSRQFYDGPNGGHIQWAFGAVSMMSID